MFDLTREGTPLHVFAAENGEAIQNAAFLLGGRSWLSRAQRLLNELQCSCSVNPRVLGEARNMHRLFTLEYVHDFDAPESGYFATLDPEMPYVEEICLLADELAEALDAMAKQTSGKHHFGMQGDMA